MSSLLRKRVEVDEDPLMKIINRPSEDDITSSFKTDPPYSAPPVQSAPVATIPRAAEITIIKEKSSVLFEGTEPEIVRPKPVATSKQSVKTPLKPAITVAEDLLTPSTISSEYNTEDNIFRSVPTAAKAEKSPKSTKAAVAKIDFNKEDDEIGDLQVASLLEKEDKLDYALFGKVESIQEKKVVQQKKPMMEIEAETDFLRQLDELTAKASTSSYTFPQTPEAREVDNPVAIQGSTPTAAPKELDLNSLDLNAYIEQESGSGGGLFDD